MFEDLEKCFSFKPADQADLINLRGQTRVITTCSVKNNVVEDLSHIFLKGFSVRVLVNGSWGFSSKNTFQKKDLSETLVNAVKLARASSNGKKQSVEKSEKVKAHVESPTVKPVENVSIEDVAKIPLEACKSAKEADPRIVEAKTTFISIKDEKFFLSSEGSRIRQAITRVMLYANVVAKSGALIVPLAESVGHAGGLELFDNEDPSSLGRHIGDYAVKLLEVKAPPSGKFHVVIHPTLCATLLHEAIGHPLEADLAMAGGGFGGHVGETVSSKLVSIYDDGSLLGGLGYLPYDDEGVPSERTVLIENGVLKTFLHDRSSASVAGVNPTGNAHAWDYSVEPLIRQTNIGIEAGDYAVDELVEDVDSGLLLEGTFGGQANVNADFTFGFQHAKRIQNGRITEEFRGANVAGNAIEVFKTVDAVGNKATLRPGACGKFQFAVQGRKVPPIRCRIMVGGMGGL